MGNTLEEHRQTAAAPLDEDKIRAEMEAALAEEGRALMRAAPEIGIPYGTVSSWKNGTYQGNTQKVAAAVQAWLISRTARARARAVLPVEPDFVMTRTASQIYDVLEFAQTTPCIGMITGSAGVGKTKAFQAYREQLQRTVWIATMQPYHRSINAMLREIGWSLGMTEASTNFLLVQSIVRKLRDTRGLLIIDEAQHLPSDALDQARSLQHAADVGMVLAGNVQLAANMGADRRSSQLAQLHSRIGIRLHRDRPLKDDIRSLLDAWKLTGEEERGVAMAIALKPGGARVMTMVLRMASMMAVAAGAEAPNVAHLQAAWQQLGMEGVA